MHNEIYKKCPDPDYTEISLGGQFKLESQSHTHIGLPEGFNLNFFNEHPRHFYMGVPPAMNNGNRTDFIPGGGYSHQMIRQNPNLSEFNLGLHLTGQIPEFC